MDDSFERRRTYNQISSSLASLSDDDLAQVVTQAKPLGKSIGGHTALLKLSDKNIFIKKISLTDIERKSGNELSTANLFHLPLYYQYGIGSSGFGVWRELATHLMTTKWVLSGDCLNFTMLFHWRVLPVAVKKPTNKDLEKLEADVKYWNNSQAVRERLVAILQASAEVVLFLEYFPTNLYQWCKETLDQDPEKIEAACRMIEEQLLPTLSFMNSRRLIHFDAHFFNILTCGKQLYFSDFGLAMSSNFDLSEKENEFFKQHLSYDQYSSVASFLYCLILYYFGESAWPSILQTNFDNNLPPHVAKLITRYAPVARLMAEFFTALKQDKTTPYPEMALRQAWSKLA